MSRQSCVSTSSFAGRKLEAAHQRVTLLHNFEDPAPVCRRTQVTVGANGQIKDRYVGQAGAVQAPACTPVSRLENSTVSAGVEIGRICWINHERVHRDIGNSSTIDRCPSDG